MVDQSFFEEPREQSLIKSTIVSKYFPVWSKIIISVQKRNPVVDQKIAYIDLFSGPGKYADGTESTPIKILSYATSQPDLQQRLITIFNDRNPEFSDNLKKTIAELPDLDKLAHMPAVYKFEVGASITPLFKDINLIPTFFFIDPWGYKGVSLDLIHSLVKDWGSDGLIFFNYNRINMGINNPVVRSHMEALFGLEQYDQLAEKLMDKPPEERENTIVEELCQALKSRGVKYVLPFRFRGKGRHITSHHLIFLSKHFLGYDIMKGIMAKESTTVQDGVPSLEYNPADNMPRQTLLFQLNQPLVELEADLLEAYRGRSIHFEQLYEEHSVDRPYIRKNYQDVLRQLYEAGIIKAITKKGKPFRKGSFSKENTITFPA